MSAECEAVRSVMAGVIEGAVEAPHVAACAGCGAAAEAERATRDAVRRAAPAWQAVAPARRKARRFPAWSVAAAGLLFGLSLAGLDGAGPDVPPADAPRIVLPGRSEPEWAQMTSREPAPLTDEDLTTGRFRRNSPTREGGR